MSTETIEIKNLNQFYGRKQALKNVTLNIGTGMFGLLGRNGAGKTTLMKVLVTLLPVSQGEVTVCKIPVGKEAQIRKITGYLPQEFSMYANMTVYEAMDYLGVLSGLRKAERKDRIPSLLEKVNLKDKSRVKIKALSGGMKRRLGIAQAILHDPRILIVDEPTAGLDPEERVRFRNLLCEIAQERIVILSTHIVGDIEATCERIGVLEEGEIIYQGSVTELIERAKGKIYAAEINHIELTRLKEEYPVTSMVSNGNHVNVRFISKDKPFDGAEACEANVEDAYIYLMQEKRGEM
ncbi:MAG: ABC transporter ATP-binding protein [Clostridiales bacterium]|jgi:ABC-2 type transport system ATP-binding protein|nr:ABC transporter ATP-binding protein [Clostridiales bacterium]